MTRTLLISLLALFTSAQAFQTCELSTIPQVEEVLFIESDLNESDCLYVKDSFSIIERVSELTSYKRPINLIIHQSGNTAHFDMGHSIHMSKSYQNEKYTYSREANLSILAHEYAHAILKEELRNTSPRLKFFYKKMESFSQSKTEEIKNKKIQSDLTEEERISHSSYKRDYGLFSASPIANKINDAKLAYHEFFADLVAALVFDNKGTIHHALEVPGDPLLRINELARYRSFEEQDNTNLLGEDVSAHTLFFHARQYIGHNLWPTNKILKRDLIKATTNAIKEEVRLNLRDRNFASKSIQELNERLVKRIEKNLDSSGR